MPYTEPSWRLWPQLQKISKFLCVVGIHHWLMSKTMNKPLACSVCFAKTKHFEEYEKLKQNP